MRHSGELASRVTLNMGQIIAMRNSFYAHLQNVHHVTYFFHAHLLEVRAGR